MTPGSSGHLLKRVHVPRGYEGLHIEIDGVLVNIWTKLANTEGQRVVTISVSPDEGWTVRDVNEGGMRVVQGDRDQCYWCSGSGKIVGSGDDCPDCKGTGRKPVEVAT